MSEKFSYQYSSEMKKEIEDIKKKYDVDEAVIQDKMEVLRKLDASTGKKPTMISILIGVVGTLFLGGGMSCILEWHDQLFLIGIILGGIGLIIMGAAYPLHTYLYKKERERVAPQILALADELQEMM